MVDRNYIIGRGERLVRPVAVPSGPPNKVHPYTFLQVRERTLPQWKEVAEQISSLPKLACPNDEAVFSLILNPAYLAMSYFPKKFLDHSLLRSVGSRAIRLKPAGNVRKKPSDKMELAPELFIAGQRKTIRSLVASLPDWLPPDAVQEDFREIEKVISLDERRNRVPISKSDSIGLLEIALHVDENDESILEGFREYLASLDVKVDLDQRFQVAGLCFLPVRAPLSMASAISQYSFLRVLRTMPKLRLNTPILRSARHARVSVTFPDAEPIDPSLRIAAFDGGLPSKTPVARWVKRYKPRGIGSAHPDFQAHGLAVTSALLFGPLQEGQPAPRPVCHVDHWRVLDEDDANDGDVENLYGILQRIASVLETKNYTAASLSMGPALPIEDDEPHVWTSVLDQHLSNGQTFFAAAVGNDGERDHASGLARIQPPADAVNALAVGATDTMVDGWSRASYSSIGPGRSPGTIKPDIVAFGGAPTRPFLVLDATDPRTASGTYGTSFATPFAARTGMSIRAHFGPDISPVALKAMLIHHAEGGKHAVEEVGWGMVSHDLEDLVTCKAGEAHILYQGRLLPGSGMRMPIPIPSDPIPGKVTIRATICFATEIDPHHPISYTQAGLLPTFRPNTVDPPKPGKNFHPTKSFFKTSDYWSSEAELRQGTHKWENVLRRQETFFGSTLKDPVFDLHHLARDNGQRAGRSSQINYAAVITVRAPRMLDIYENILVRYRNYLEALRPVHEIPIRAGRAGKR